MLVQFNLESTEFFNWNAKQTSSAASDFKNLNERTQAMPGPFLGIF